VTPRAEIAPAWRDALAALGLSDPAALLDTAPDRAGLPGRLELLSKPGLGGRERWRWTIEAEGAARVLYIKRYPAGSLRTQWDRWLRQDRSRGRAGWEYLQARRLNDASIPAAGPVAFAEQVGGALERRGVVILERAPGDALDRTLLREAGAGGAWLRGPARHELTRRLARFVSAFHTAGWCHRDLYLCHIFVDLPAASLIDLARSFTPRLRRMRWVLKDLSQLDSSARAIGLSRTDRLRFLRTYLALERGAPRIRWYAPRIVRRSDRIRARDARRAERAGRAARP
jgi:heptose I phosphotransferase